MVMQNILFLVLIVFCSFVQAQQGSFSDAEIRNSLQIDTSQLTERQSRTPVASLIAPTAFGLDGNTVFVGLSGSDSSVMDVDGSLSVGFGLGDASKLSGVEVSINIISLTDEFGEDGSVGFKWHAKVAPQTRVAVGFTNALQWGAANDTDNTLFAVLSKEFSIGWRGAAISIGAGTGRFTDFGSPLSDSSSVSGFLSANLQLANNISLNTDLGRNAFGVGVTAVVPRTPFVMTFGITQTDIRANDSAVSGIVSFGTAHKF